MDTRDTCSVEIGLHAQNSSNILGSIVNIIGGTSVAFSWFTVKGTLIIQSNLRLAPKLSGTDPGFFKLYLPTQLNFNLTSPSSMRQQTTKSNQIRPIDLTLESPTPGNIITTKQTLPISQQSIRSPHCYRISHWNNDHPPNL